MTHPEASAKMWRAGVQPRIWVSLWGEMNRQFHWSDSIFHQEMLHPPLGCRRGRPSPKPPALRSLSGPVGVDHTPLLPLQPAGAPLVGPGSGDGLQTYDREAMVRGIINPFETQKKPNGNSGLG